MSLLGNCISLSKFQNNSIDMKTFKESAKFFSKNNKCICNMESFAKAIRNEHFWKVEELEIIQNNPMNLKTNNKST